MWEWLKDLIWGKKKKNGKNTVKDTSKDNKGDK